MGSLLTQIITTLLMTNGSSFLDTQHLESLILQADLSFMPRKTDEFKSCLEVDSQFTCN